MTDDRLRELVLLIWGGKPGDTADDAYIERMISGCIDSLRAFAREIQEPLRAHIKMHVEGTGRDQLRAVVEQRDHWMANHADLLRKYHERAKLLLASQEREKALAEALGKAASRIEQGIANRMYGEQDASDSQVEAAIDNDPVLIQACIALAAYRGSEAGRKP